MCYKPRKRLFFLLGVGTLLLALLSALMLAGCLSKPGSEPLIQKSSENEFNEALSDQGFEAQVFTELVEESPPVLLTANDIVALPAGTIIQMEQLDTSGLSVYFVSIPIPDDVFTRINGKSYVENPYVSLDDLRYLKLLHYNFEHQVQVGELIVSAELDLEFLEIFRELFYREYEIQSMHLVDNFWTGDTITTDDASIAVNNTSAFSYRIVPETGNLSKHAFGKAIDINPRQNPYVEYYDGVPYWEDENADPYIDRSSGNDHMITHDDDCFIIFQSYGYIWGGDWWFPLDYQHFEK